MATIDITIPDSIAVVDTVAREPDRIDILLSDVIAIADDLVPDPGEMVITGFEPTRVRRGDTGKILGRGFPAGGASRVEVSVAGNPPVLSATVTSSTATEILVTWDGFIFDFVFGPVRVDVDSLVDSRSATSQELTSKKPVTTVADDELIPQVPGVFEGIVFDDPERFEAGDHERLATVVEHLIRGVGVLAGSSAGVVEPTTRNRPDSPDPLTFSPFSGQVLVVDPSSPSGVGFGWKADLSLPFGGSMLAGASGAILLVAGGAPTDPTAGAAETEERSPGDLRLDLVWLLTREIVGGDTIDRVRVLVNGAPVFDSGAGLALDTLFVFSADIDVLVEQDDIIELEATKAGTTGELRIVAGIRGVLQ